MEEGDSPRVGCLWPHKLSYYMDDFDVDRSFEQSLYLCFVQTRLLVHDWQGHKGISVRNWSQNIPALANESMIKAVLLMQLLGKTYENRSTRY
eukprot:1365976-Amphidinium_carterae.1